MLDQQSLEKIVTDHSSTAAERLTAQHQLDALHPTSPTNNSEERAVDLCGPLGLDLLRFAVAHELSEIRWRDLVHFADADNRACKWDDHDVQRLWLGWIVWVGCESSPTYKVQIWNAIKEQFASDQDRRVEFERIARDYPLFDLMAGDNPYELESNERNLGSSDRKLILAIARKRLDEAPEYAFRTSEVAQRIIEKLTRRK